MRETIYSFKPTAGLSTAGNLRQAAQAFPVASDLRVPLEFHRRGSTGLNPEGNFNQGRVERRLLNHRHIGFVEPVRTPFSGNPVSGAPISTNSGLSIGFTTALGQ
jgi:hypothetical protein